VSSSAVTVKKATLSLTQLKCFKAACGCENSITSYGYEEERTRWPTHCGRLKELYGEWKSSTTSQNMAKSKDDLYTVEVIEEEAQEGKVKVNYAGMARVMMSGWSLASGRCALYR